MYNPIDQLRNLAICTATSVHDEEALSALQLAGRTAAKVNECVKLVNEVCEKLDKDLANTLKAVIEHKLANGTLDLEIDKIIEEVLGGSY